MKNSPLRLECAGTHSTGKSTFARALALYLFERGHLPEDFKNNIDNIIIPGSSRMSVKKYDIKVTENADDYAQIVLNLELLNNFMEGPFRNSHLKPAPVTIAERSLHDCYGYAMANNLSFGVITLTQNLKRSWILQAQPLTIFFPHEAVQAEDDGFRGTDVEYREKVSAFIKDSVVNNPIVAKYESIILPRTEMNIESRVNYVYDRIKEHL